jgi:tetratricopeptide (TPR) repeat protein
MAYGTTAKWTGNTEATASLQEALDIWTALGNKLEAGHLHFLMGTEIAVGNEMDKAMPHYQEAFSIFQSLGDPKLLAMAKYGLGFGYVCSFEPDKAEPLLEEALPELIRFDIRRYIGLTRHVLGDCALLRKDYSESFRRYKVALKAIMHAKDYAQAYLELHGIAMSLAGMSFFKDAIMLDGAVVHFMYKRFGIREIPVDFWKQSIEETIGKAKQEVGPELVKQYEEEGIAMGFEKAAEYALEFEPD